MSGEEVIEFRPGSIELDKEVARVIRNIADENADVEAKRIYGRAIELGYEQALEEMGFSEEVE